MSGRSDDGRNAPELARAAKAKGRAPLTLYTTDHCTLCERALDLLQSMPEARARMLRVVDVVSDDALTARYGPRLPVLSIGTIELDWPFDRTAVVDALANGG